MKATVYEIQKRIEGIGWEVLETTIHPSDAKNICEYYRNASDLPPFKFRVRIASDERAAAMGYR